MKILGYLATALLVVFIADAFCFALWVASGQHPHDGFYAGALTAHVLGAVAQ